MRAVSVHRDALVLTSRMWQTTATALRAGGESVLIDSPYFPDELEALPGLLAGAGFEPDGLLATHGDFDHLLGRLAFPGLALGLGESTVERLHREPGAAQRKLRDSDSLYYVARVAPLALGQVQALPVPGRVELGGEELELHPAEGHTSDGVAVFARSLGVLVVGDYLSDVEIPMVSEGGSITAYIATATARRWRGSRRWWRPRRWWCPGMGRSRTARGRCVCSTRTWSTWTRWSGVRSGRGCLPAAIRPRSVACTRRTWRRCLKEWSQCDQNAGR